MRFLGVDLAWREKSAARTAADTGVVALEPSGEIVAADWTVGIAETVEWIEEHATKDTLLFVDAPLVVENERGQRPCEKQVGQRYGRWKVSANSTNLGTPRLGGVTLRRTLEELGWRYADGREGPARQGCVVSECYPYTTLVGVPELGYELERPTYKRKPRRLRAAEWRPLRASVCDELIQRIASLWRADPPLELASHPQTRLLIEEPSPLADVRYKRREDLLDAVLCAWTAAYWWRHGATRSQVLGITPEADRAALATIIARARSEQRIAPTE